MSIFMTSFWTSQMYEYRELAYLLPVLFCCMFDVSNELVLLAIFKLMLSQCLFRLSIWNMKWVKMNLLHGAESFLRKY
jgi:hypothetical protein